MVGSAQHDLIPNSHIPLESSVQAGLNGVSNDVLVTRIVEKIDDLFGDFSKNL